MRSPQATQRSEIISKKTNGRQAPVETKHTKKAKDPLKFVVCKTTSDTIEEARYRAAKRART